MSNHAGSYMLNEMLQLMEQRSVFEKIGREASQQLVLEIVKLSDRYDCNAGEILEDLGERLAICSFCRAVRPDVQNSGCGVCRDASG